MSAKIEISELRIGYVLGAPIFDDNNVKLLGQGVTIAENFIRQLKRRGIRAVQVTEEDLARLRGWNLSADSPANAATKQGPRHESAPAPPIDQSRFCRYLAAISEVGRQHRTEIGPLGMIRASARLAAIALDAHDYAFGLTFPHGTEMTFFHGRVREEEDGQKLNRYSLDASRNSLMAASMATAAPLVVADVRASERLRDQVLAELGIATAAAVPLHRGSQPAGAIGVLYRDIRNLDQHDLSFLETVANMLRVPFELGVVELDAESETFDPLKASQRYDYRCWQGIAPLEGEHVPPRAAYEEVLCRDISMGGFSFYYPRRPNFNRLAVALGQPPQLKQMKAAVVSCCDIELDGEPCALVSCRFAGPLLIS